MLLNNWCFHAVFGKRHPRRTLVLKFSTPRVWRADAQAKQAQGAASVAEFRETVLPTGLRESEEPRVREVAGRVRAELRRARM